MRAAPLFSKPLVELLAAALERECILVRCIASLCELLIEDLEELFAAHGIEYAIEL